MFRIRVALTATVAAFVVAIIFSLGPGSGTWSAAAASSGAAEPAPASPPPAGEYMGMPTAGMTIGSPDAPVLVEEYFDFQCPHCQNASENVVKPLLQTYVKSGKVRFAYRLFAFLGPESELAARGAYCAAKEGAFWPYQELLFARRGTRNQGAYSRENLIADAGRLNLDAEAFAQCLESEEAGVYVAGSYERARLLGVRGTPTYAVNGTIIYPSSGAEFVQAIEAALAAADNASGNNENE